MERLFYRIIDGELRGPVGAVARGMLAGLSVPYGLAVRLRNAGFDRGWRRQVELPRPTVSVGNLTVGGTGKTPVVAWLAGELVRRGRRPAVLMRGYKSRPGEAGDEQRLLRELLGDGVPVEADPDRLAAAHRAVAGSPEVDVFLLDDGFQHRRVRRAFDLVLVDATRPGGRVLPRGTLREPAAAGLRRASAVLVTRRDHAPVPAVLFEGPVFTSRFEVELPGLGGRPVAAACGVGNPAAFFADLRRIGCDVRAELMFADHHDYGAADVRRIVDAVPENGAAVVTGKDWVKLADLWPAGVPIVRARQRVVIDKADDLVDLILRAVPATRHDRNEARP